MSDSKLREHAISLQDGDLVLRPMTENDWGMLLKWNSDAEVLYYAEGDDVSSRTLAEIQGIYRYVSQTALCFIIELDGQPIGDCWLQSMNLDRILQKYPDVDCRRIDLLIGEKTLWGQGLGTRTIRLLVKLAFEQEEADMIFGLVGDYNLRSQRAFQKNGFTLDAKHELPPGGKAKFDCDYILRRGDFSG